MTDGECQQGLRKVRGYLMVKGEIQNALFRSVTQRQESFTTGSFQVARSEAGRAVVRRPPNLTIARPSGVNLDARGQSFANSHALDDIP